MVVPTREEALRSIKRGSWTPKYIQHYLREKDFIREAMRLDLRILEYIPSDLKSDRPFVTELIKLDYGAFMFISRELAHDREFIKEMMLNHGVSLWVLPYDLQDDVEFVNIAVTLEPLLKRFMVPDKYIEKEIYELR